MRRLTTPSIIILFPTDAQEYDKILVTFSQRNEIILEKKKEDLIFNTDTERNIFSGMFVLSQEETGLFDDKVVLSMQVRMFKEDEGWCFASKIYSINVDDVLNEEVMTNDI